MAVFDPSLDAAPVKEKNTDPILPEERFVFELIGFERSAPDQYHKNGGIKWTFAVYHENGQPFLFQDQPYELFRTTNTNAEGKPLFNIGTEPHEYAQALLGRPLGIDAHFSISELRNKRMSAQVVWKPKKTKPGEKAATLAIFRHVPGSTAAAPVSAPRPEPDQVSADPTDDEIDRALVVGKLKKQLERLGRLDASAGATARAAVDKFDLATAPLDALQALLDRTSAEVQKALDV